MSRRIGSGDSGKAKEVPQRFKSNHWVADMIRVSTGFSFPVGEDIASLHGEFMLLLLL